MAEPRKRKVNHFKALLITIATISGIFLIIVAGWYFGFFIRYKKLEKGMTRVVYEREEEMNFPRYETEYNGYTIYMKETGFLGDGGFIKTYIGSGENRIQLDENYNIIDTGDSIKAVYIYPKFWGKTVYVFAIESMDDFDRIYVNEDGTIFEEYRENYSETAWEEATEICNVNRELITDLIRNYKEFADLF